MISKFLILFLCSLTLHVSSSFSKDSLFSRSTQLKDIEAWRMLGDRHAVGKDEQGKSMVITDLTMENGRSLSYGKRALLGTISLGNLQLKHLIEFLKEMVFSSEQTLSSDLQKEAGVQTTADLMPLLDKWNNQFGQISTTLPQDWWQKIPWKQEFLLEQSQKSPSFFSHGPEHFSLSDLDMNLLSQQSPRFAKALQEWTQQWSKFFSPHFPLQESQILNQIQYAMNEQGNLHAIFHFNIPFAQDRLTPEILMDLAHPHPNALEQAAWSTLKKAAGKMTDLIPHKLAKVLISYPIDRFFYLHEQRLNHHRLMGLEHINALEAGHEVSAFSSLTPAERESAALYLFRQNDDWFKKLFGITNARTWKKSVQEEIKKGQQSLSRLLQTQEKVEHINPWFALGSKGEQKKIFALAQPRPFSSLPQVVLDLNHPQQEVIKRHLAEGFAVALKFVDLPVPVVGGLMIKLFDHFVTAPIERSKMWEARLISHLHQRQSMYSSRSENESWDREIKWLYELRMNPFELDREEENEILIQRRSSLNWQ